MPATTAQLLAFVPALADGGASATNPTPNLCNASGTLSVGALQPVIAASSPRPLTAAGTNINVTCASAAALTTGGVLNAAISVRLGVAGAALSGAFNPQSSLGMLRYGGIVGNNDLLDGIPSEVQVPLVSLGMPTSLAASTGWQSPPVFAMGQKHISWGLTSSQTINLSITRYTDPQGISSIGAVTATATAATAMSLDNHDGLGFMSFSLGATNTSGSVTTLSSFSLLLSAT